MTTTVDMRHPGVAAVLSVIIPGVGQIHNRLTLSPIFPVAHIGAYSKMDLAIVACTPFV